MNKKAWLDYLYYNVGKQQYDFFVAGAYKKDEKICFTKWKKFSAAVFPIDFDGTCKDWETQKFFEQINQRQIFPNEVILDIEEEEKIKPIVEELEEKGWEYLLYKTGGRGFHISILFKEELNEREKLKIIKEFGADEQKASDKCLIALEHEPHWKGKGIKTEIKKEEILDGA